MPKPVVPSWERYRPEIVIGRHMLAYREVDSTMDVAWTLAEHEAAHGTVVRAEYQRAGRGRFARRWESGPGESLLLSALLRFPPLPPGAAVSVAACLAVFECIEEFVPGRASIKWPNDVLVDGQKVAGVLVEARIATDGNGVAVVGIGMNLFLGANTRARVGAPAASLFAAKHSDYSSTSRIEDHLLRALDEHIVRESTDLVADWRAHLSTLGSIVSVRTREGLVTGIAEDVDSTGRLSVRDSDSGHIHVLSEGDVTLRE